MKNIAKQFYLYPIVVEPCEEGGYFASCPMLQGCHAEGETYGETIDNINDVIKAHLELREKNGEFNSFVSFKKMPVFNIQIPVPIMSQGK